MEVGGMRKKRYLGELEQMILMAILQLGDEAYGLNILKELEDRAGRRVTPGALYPTLDRLEGKGFVASRFADPDPRRGGKPKRFVRVTRHGRVALSDARTAWARMAEGLGRALGGE